jgi:hypothetical protein
MSSEEESRRGFLSRLFGLGAAPEADPVELPDARAYTLGVVGVTHANKNGSSRQDIIRDCKVGFKVRLKREPDNRVTVKSCGSEVALPARDVS